MERHFPIKLGQPIEMVLIISNSSSEFPNLGKEPVCQKWVKNGTANFGRNIPTEICGPPPEVTPSIPVKRNRNGSFHLNSDRNYRNLWHNGKHPKWSKLYPSFFLTSLDEITLQLQKSMKLSENSLRSPKDKVCGS